MRTTTSTMSTVTLTGLQSAQMLTLKNGTMTMAVIMRTTVPREIQGWHECLRTPSRAALQR